MPGREEGREGTRYKKNAVLTLPSVQEAAGARCAG